MRITNVLLIVSFAAKLGAANGAVNLTLSSNVSEVVLGQSLLAILHVRNDTTDTIVVYDTRELTKVIVSGLDGATIKLPLPPPSLDAASFGKGVEPGALQSIPIAITELGELTTPGEYSIRVSIPAWGVQSTTLHVLVTRPDVSVLASWSRQLADEIVSNPWAANSAELVKELSSVRGNLAEPELCRVVAKAPLVAVPTAVGKLASLASQTAANCLIDALPAYSGSSSEFLRAALRRMQPTLADSALRMRIDEVAPK